MRRAVVQWLCDKQHSLHAGNIVSRGPRCHCGTYVGDVEEAGVLGCISTGANLLFAGIPVGDTLGWWRTHDGPRLCSLTRRQGVAVSFRIGRAEAPEPAVVAPDTRVTSPRFSCPGDNLVVAHSQRVAVTVGGILLVRFVQDLSTSGHVSLQPAPKRLTQVRPSSGLVTARGRAQSYVPMTGGWCR